MGTLDACFMFAYAAGLFVSGFIADRNDLRLVLSTGMALTSVVVFLFGAGLPWLGVRSKVGYAVVWVVNGLLQSTGWPCVVAIMGNWFGKGSRGLVMGLWSSCASMGNIIGALLVAAVLDYGYEYAFLTTASVLLAGALFNLVGLVPSPVDVGLQIDQDEEEEEEEEGEEKGESAGAYVNGGADLLEVPAVHNGGRLQMDQLSNGVKVAVDLKSNNGTLPNGAKQLDDPESPAAKVIPLDFDPRDTHTKDQLNQGVKPGIDLKPTNGTILANGAKPQGDPENQVEFDLQDTRPKAINFFTAFLLPGVLPYALCYAFLKLVNYAFFFWLPFYLSNSYDMPETAADQLSIWYDIGGIVGGTVAGLVSDWLGARTVVVMPMLLLSVPMLFVYGMTGVAGTVVNNGVLLFVLGSLIGGVANLIR